MNYFAVAKKTVPKRVVRLNSIRSFYSYDHLNPDDFLRANKDVKSTILAGALKHGVKSYGFSDKAVERAIAEYKKKHTEVSDWKNLDLLFESKSDDLIDYYLTVTRLRIAEVAELPEFKSLTTELEKLKFLMRKRIEDNIEFLKHSNGTDSSVSANLLSLLSQLVFPTKVPQSVTQLSSLADDLLFYAGDKSHEFDWYEKRAKIAAIFVKTELYMVLDKSEDFLDTFRFLDTQLDLYDKVNGFVDNFKEWSLFNAFSLINLVKSQLLRG